MEDGLRVGFLDKLRTYAGVLILVLVEDGLRGPKINGNKSRDDIVLILVLVEDGLREQKTQCDDH